MMNTKKYKIEFEIEVVTGLSILSGVETFEIGGLDRPIIKTVYKSENKDLKVPFIPGSSLKGKISSLLERKYFPDLLKLIRICGIIRIKNFDESVAVVTEKVLDILNENELNDIEKKIKEYINTKRDSDKSKIETMIEYYNDGKLIENVKKIDKNLLERFLRLFRSKDGVVLIFEDLYPTEETLKYWEKVTDLTYDFGTDIKYENIIDRLTGKAQHPRSIERVIPGSKFAGRIIYIAKTDNNEEINKDLELIKEGLNLLEKYSYLGSSGSRGYGRIKITKLDTKEF